VPGPTYLTANSGLNCDPVRVQLIQCVSNSRANSAPEMPEFRAVPQPAKYLPAQLPRGALRSSGLPGQSLAGESETAPSGHTAAV
jgi:hypothetical protein